MSSPAPLLRFRDETVVGIAVAGPSSTGERLMADADAARDRAKELGRNRFTVAGPAPGEVVPAGGGT